MRDRVAVPCFSRQLLCALITLPSNHFRLNLGSKKDDNFPMSVDDLLGSITAVDESIRGKSRDYSVQLLKAPHALGRLESLGAQLSALTGSIPPDLPHPAAVVVFAADHGITRSEPSRRQPDLSARMTAAMCNGSRCARSAVTFGRRGSSRSGKTIVFMR